MAWHNFNPFPITSKRSTKIKNFWEWKIPSTAFHEAYLTLVQKISAEGLRILNFTKSLGLTSIVRAEINEEIESSLQVLNMWWSGKKEKEKGKVQSSA